MTSLDKIIRVYYTVSSTWDHLSPVCHNRSFMRSIKWYIILHTFLSCFIYIYIFLLCVICTRQCNTIQNICPNNNATNSKAFDAISACKWQWKIVWSTVCVICIMGTKVQPVPKLFDAWHRVTNIMMTTWNGNIFRVIGPLCGELTGPGIPHKDQWRRALMFSLICAWIHGWVNNRGAGDLRRHRAHYDVIVIYDSNEPI